MKTKIYTWLFALAFGLATFSCGDSYVEPSGSTTSLKNNVSPTAALSAAAALSGPIFSLGKEITPNGFTGAMAGYVQFSFGVTFKTHQPGNITHLGVVTPLIKGSIVIRIWDPLSHSTPLLATTVAINRSTPGAAYVELATPLNLTPEKEYIVSLTANMGVSSYILQLPSKADFLPHTEGNVTLVNFCSNFWIRSATNTVSDYPGDGFIQKNQIIGYPDFIFAAQ